MFIAILLRNSAEKKIAPRYSSNTKGIEKLNENPRVNFLHSNPDTRISCRIFLSPLKTKPVIPMIRSADPQAI
jgi:hypothetical protein